MLGKFTKRRDARQAHSHVEAVMLLQIRRFLRVLFLFASPNLTNQGSLESTFRSAHSCGKSRCPIFMSCNPCCPVISHTVTHLLPSSSFLGSRLAPPMSVSQITPPLSSLGLCLFLSLFHRGGEIHCRAESWQPTFHIHSSPMLRCTRVSILLWRPYRSYAAS